MPPRRTIRAPRPVLLTCAAVLSTACLHGGAASAAPAPAPAGHPAAAVGAWTPLRGVAPTPLRVGPLRTATLVPERDARGSGSTTAGARLAAPPSTWVVDWVGSWPADGQAKAAYQRAVDIWARLVASSVPIHVSATWRDLGDPDLLGQTGPHLLYFDPGNRASPAYPVAMLEAMSGQDLDPGESDIDAEFNSSPSVPWYLGTGTPPPGQEDFTTVALHELGHGLGLVGDMSVGGGLGTWGGDHPAVYDSFTRARVPADAPLLAYPDRSTALSQALTSRSLTWTGPLGLAANGCVPVPLYAPSPWQGGSSFSHLDESTFPAGNPNSLMTPYLNAGEVVRDPGPVALGMLADMGFPLAAPPPTVGTTLGSGQTLAAGQSLVAPHGCYRLVMQADGNAVLYGPPGPVVPQPSVLWSSRTSTPGSRLVLQSDGNLVVYAPSGQPLWNSRTFGTGPSSLVVQDDGNAVLYRGAAVWNSLADAARPPTDTLASNGRLGPGERLTSAGGRYALLVQIDGNVVVYGPTGALWSTRTNRPGSFLVQQIDGNAVVYGPNGVPVWSSGTAGVGGSRLLMQSDGNLVVYSGTGRPAWSSR